LSFTALQQAKPARSGTGKRHQRYPSGLLTPHQPAKPLTTGQRHKTTTILQFARGRLLSDRFNDILPVVRSKIVDKYNIPLN
jgi:hypothetical protein